MKLDYGKWAPGLLLALLVLPQPAMADIIYTPPVDYEEECTLDKVHFNGLECEICDVDQHVGSDCSEQYSPDGFSWTCSTEGEGFSEEIWCRESPGASGPAGDPQGDSPSCSVSLAGNGSGPGLGLGVALAFLCVGIWLWRRQ